MSCTLFEQRRNPFWNIRRLSLTLSKKNTELHLDLKITATRLPAHASSRSSARSIARLIARSIDHVFAAESAGPGRRPGRASRRSRRAESSPPLGASPLRPETRLAREGLLDTLRGGRKGTPKGKPAYYVFSFFLGGGVQRKTYTLPLMEETISNQLVGSLLSRKLQPPKLVRDSVQPQWHTR